MIFKSWIEQIIKDAEPGLFIHIWLFLLFWRLTDVGHRWHSSTVRVWRDQQEQKGNKQATPTSFAISFRERKRQRVVVNDEIFNFYHSSHTLVTASQKKSVTHQHMTEITSNEVHVVVFSMRSWLRRSLFPLDLFLFLSFPFLFFRFLSFCYRSRNKRTTEV